MGDFGTLFDFHWITPAGPQKSVQIEFRLIFRVPPVSQFPLGNGDGGEFMSIQTMNANHFFSDCQNALSYKRSTKKKSNLYFYCHTQCEHWKVYLLAVIDSPERNCANDSLCSCCCLITLLDRRYRRNIMVVWCDSRCLTIKALLKPFWCWASLLCLEMKGFIQFGFNSQARQC